MGQHQSKHPSHTSRLTIKDETLRDMLTKIRRVLEDPVYNHGARADSTFDMLQDMAAALHRKTTIIRVPVPCDGVAPVYCIDISTKATAVVARAPMLRTEPAASRRTRSFRASQYHEYSSTVSDTPRLVHNAMDDVMDALESMSSHDEMEPVEEPETGAPEDDQGTQTAAQPMILPTIVPEIVQDNIAPRPRRVRAMQRT
jgi:hypothetical protein